MKILKFIALSIIALIVVLGVVGLFLPNAQHVERQITIQAPASKIFPYFNDFRKFNEWSPWAKLDPDTKYTFSGAESGVGAKIEWASEDDSVGKGSQEIIESRPNEFVKTELDFGMGEPAQAMFTLSEEGENTSLTWAFDTYLDTTISKYFGLMLDKWVGSSYEEGLADLKILAESQ